MKKILFIAIIGLFMTGCAITGNQQEQGPREVLTAEAIKQLALNHSQLNQDDVEFDTVELNDDGTKYNVVLKDKEKRVVYVIEANSGKIMNSETTPVDQSMTNNPNDNTNSGSNNSTSSNNTGSSNSNTSNNKTQLTKDEALNYALKHAGVSRNDIKIKEIELDRDDGRLIYEIEFYTSNREYDYDIDAYTGKVLEMDYDIDGFDIPQSNNDIGMAKAKEIALKQVPGANQNHFTDSERDYDDGKIKYEFEIIYNGYEYDIEIDGTNGTVIDVDKESVYD